MATKVKATMGTRRSGQIPISRGTPRSGCHERPRDRDQGHNGDADFLCQPSEYRRSLSSSRRTASDVLLDVTRANLKGGHHPVRLSRNYSWRDPVLTGDAIDPPVSLRSSPTAAPGAQAEAPQAHGVPGAPGAWPKPPG